MPHGMVPVSAVAEETGALPVLDGSDFLGASP